MDTIFALSSGRLPSAIAIVRLSGPLSGRIVRELVDVHLEPRLATLCHIREIISGDLLDHAIVIWFPGPGSFTGEDSAEFHVHGSLAVIGALCRALAVYEGCRLAEPGEFTRRAFLNGKLDLTEAEGLRDLIESETELQRRQALRGLMGGLSGKVEIWRNAIIESLALIEAAIDFADESEAPQSVLAEVEENMQQLRGDLVRALSDARRGERLRDGYTVVILGPPNVGKSSLLNCLARRDVAIVSPYAGTTRDLLEVRVDLFGLPVTFIDTAGVRTTEDEIENEGIRRARERGGSADLILWLDDCLSLETTAAENFGTKYLMVRTKSDLVSPCAVCAPVHFDFRISVTANVGIDELLAGIAERLQVGSVTFEPTLISNERQKSEISKALNSLIRVGNEVRPLEIVAEDIRLAAAHLKSVLGGIKSEDVLDKIFQRFCMGK